METKTKVRYSKVPARCTYSAVFRGEPNKEYIICNRIGLRTYKVRVRTNAEGKAPFSFHYLGTALVSPDGRVRYGIRPPDPPVPPE